MQKYIYLLAFGLLFFSCDKKSRTEREIQKIPVSMKVHRFEQAFFEAKLENLAQVKSAYPDFFPVGYPDSFWVDKMQHPQWRELYVEVEKKYKNFESEKDDIEDLFKHIKYYFPKTKIPEIYTVIGDMDYLNKTIYAKNKLIISLELYLGKEHKFYSEFPAYIKQNFEQKQILSDIVSSYYFGAFPAPKDKELLTLMIDKGKELYIKDLLLPKYSDADKIGYKEEQIKWCTENEGYMWEYFVSNKMLYNTDSRLQNCFINPAPFSKFYLEIDNETPGRVGQWLGWQIVRSYMQNNEITVTQLLKMDAKLLFENSKYKPKKNE